MHQITWDSCHIGNGLLPLVSVFCGEPENTADTCSLVGHPIHVIQRDKPTLEEIMYVQQQYIDELMWYVALAVLTDIYSDNCVQGYGTLTRMTSHEHGNGS